MNIPSTKNAPGTTDPKGIRRLIRKCIAQVKQHLSHRIGNNRSLLTEYISIPRGEDED